MSENMENVSRKVLTKKKSPKIQNMCVFQGDDVLKGIVCICSIMFSSLAAVVHIVLYVLYI